MVRAIVPAMHSLGWICVVLAATGATGMRAQPPLERDALWGEWSGTLRHAGRSTEFGLRLEPRDDAVLVRVALPEIDVWWVPVGLAQLDGSTLSWADWKLRIAGDAEEPTLQGTLPPSILPVHRVDTNLTKTSIERTGPQPAAEFGPTREPAWQRNVGAAVWAGLAASGQAVFIATESGDVLALDQRSGQQRWSTSLSATLRARPTAVADALLVHAGGGRVVQLDADSGELVWDVDLASRVRSEQDRPAYQHFASSVVAHGDVGFVGAGQGELICFSLADGSVRWRTRAEAAITATPALADGLVVFGSFDGLVRAVRTDTGESVWEFDTGAPVACDPSISGALVLVGSRSYDLLALRLRDGTHAWGEYFWFSWVEAVSVHRGRTFAGTSDAQVVQALESTNGEPLWRADLGGSVWSQPAVTPSALYAGTVGVRDYMVEHRGRFVALHPETGAALWHHDAEPIDGETNWGFAAAPCIGAEHVFAASLDGMVLAFARDE